jgi:hypothetical protein
VEPQKARRASPLSIRLDGPSRAALEARATALGMGSSAYAASIVRAAIEGRGAETKRQRFDAIRAATSGLGRVANALHACAPGVVDEASLHARLQIIDATLRGISR